RAQKLLFGLIVRIRGRLHPMTARPTAIGIAPWRRLAQFTRRRPGAAQASFFHLRQSLLRLLARKNPGARAVRDEDPGDALANHSKPSALTPTIALLPKRPSLEKRPERQDRAFGID